MSASRSSLFILLFFTLGLTSCRKDNVPEPIPLTKWEKIAGTYKVYDTTGVFLYEMEIKHNLGVNQFGLTVDSLIFKNFDGGFNFSQYQNNASNSPETFMDIGVHNPITDTFGKRWYLFVPTDTNFNTLINDTIILRFEKDNILYYLEDLVPYYSEYIKQIAVKQH